MQTRRHRAIARARHKKRIAEMKKSKWRSLQRAIVMVGMSLEKASNTITQFAEALKRCVNSTEDSLKKWR